MENQVLTTIDTSARWYTVNEIRDIDSPALLFYLDRIKHNIALAITMVGDVARLRPHVKTHKSSQVTRLMLQAGITKFKCATIAEAEMLGRCSAPDVLLAYQPVGPKINRLIALVQQFSDTRFSCLVDAVEAAHDLSAAAIAQGLVLDVYLDVNVGMNRTGVAPQKAVELYSACRQLDGLRVVGLHGYDGHITNTNVALRKTRADEAFSHLSTLQEKHTTEGFPDPVIVMGGSPTFPMHATRSGVECSPGTFVFWDWSYTEACPDMGFLPAALVVSRVVSVIDKNRLCLDLGHKSIAAENLLTQRVKWLNAEALSPVGHSEEHLVVEGSNADGYHVGDVFFGMPYHICPTVALYDTAIVVENSRVKERWQIDARGKKLWI